MPEPMRIPIVRTSATDGLPGFDLRMYVTDETLAFDAERLMAAIAAFFIANAVRLQPGERIDWASSLLVARAAGDAAIELDEMAYDGTSQVANVDNVVRMWTLQSATCETAGSPFVPARYAQQIAVAPGILEGDAPLVGVRHAAEAPVSGWVLLTPGYDGTADNFASLIATYVFDLLAKRPDAAKFLGLGPGFAFVQTPQEAIWFEETAAAG